VLASVAFVSTHFAMSHPMRAPMVRALSERGFGLAYIVVSFATLYGMSRYYGPATAEAPGMLWDAGKAGWIVATALMWIGSVLFVGSLLRNPAFPTGGKPVTHIGAATGVFAITRHPMMWGFAIWALVHAIVLPTLASLTISVSIATLALGGAYGQDFKKAKLVGWPWHDWVRRTSFIPFGRGFASPGAFALVGGTLLWLAASWAHGALGYRLAGIWALVA
jgi:uncharacterized membrane protein